MYDCGSEAGQLLQKSMLPGTPKWRPFLINFVRVTSRENALLNAKSAILLRVHSHMSISLLLVSFLFLAYDVSLKQKTKTMIFFCCKSDSGRLEESKWFYYLLSKHRARYG